MGGGRIKMFKTITAPMPLGAAVTAAPAAPANNPARRATEQKQPAQKPHQPLLCDVVLQLVDRYRYWLFLLVAAFYVAAFNGQWRMEPDAALYLSIGRNLAHGLGFTYLGRPNHLAYPGWPSLIAITFKLFGTASLIPVHVVMLLLAWAALALTYRLFLLHSGRPTAVMVTLGLGMTKTFFCYGFELWSDMPFTVGVMAFLAGYEALMRRAEIRAAQRTGDAPARERPRVYWYDWLLLVAGLGTAIVMRPTMWPLLAAIFATIAYRAIRRQMRWKTLAVAAALLVVFAAVVLMMDPRRSASHEQFGDVYERAMLQRFTAGPPGALRQQILQNVDDLVRRAASDALVELRAGPINPMLGLLVLALGVSLLFSRPLWGLWFCFLMATLLLTTPIVRYFLPVIPLLVYAWWKTMVALNRKLPRPWGNIALAVLMTFGTAVNGSKIIGVITQQRRAPFLNTYDRGTYAAVPDVARRLKSTVDNNAMVFARAPYGRVLSYLSQRAVVGTRETPVEILQKHKIYVLEPVGEDVRLLLLVLGLRETPGIFTILPPKHAGPNACAMTLHGTTPIAGAAP